MNFKIMDWSSKNFYYKSLYAAPSVAKRRLSELEGVVSDPVTQCVLKLYDSSDQQMDEVKNSSKNAPARTDIALPDSAWSRDSGRGCWRPLSPSSAP